MTTTPNVPEIQSVDEGANEPVIYSNIAAIRATPEEIIIHFGVRGIENPNRGEGIVKIYLNPAHAKRLASALARVIQGYERSFGEIAADPDQRLTPEARSILGLDVSQQEGKK